MSERERLRRSRLAGRSAQVPLERSKKRSRTGSKIVLDNILSKDESGSGGEGRRRRKRGRTSQYDDGKLPFCSDASSVSCPTYSSINSISSDDAHCVPAATGRAVFGLINYRGGEGKMVGRSDWKPRAVLSGVKAISNSTSVAYQPFPAGVLTQANRHERTLLFLNIAPLTRRNGQAG